MDYFPTDLLGMLYILGFSVCAFVYIVLVSELHSSVEMSVVVPSYSVGCSLYISIKLVFLFALLLCSLWYEQIVKCIMAWKSYSFVSTLHSLLSLCRLIWRHWSCKMPVWYILWSMCLRSSQHFQLSFKQYMEICTSPCPFLLWLLWEYMYFIISSPLNRKYE